MVTQLGKKLICIELHIKISCPHSGDPDCQTESLNLDSDPRFQHGSGRIRLKKVLDGRIDELPIIGPHVTVDDTNRLQDHLRVLHP